MIGNSTTPAFPVNCLIRTLGGGSSRTTWVLGTPACADSPWPVAACKGPGDIVKLTPQVERPNPHSRSFDDSTVIHGPGSAPMSSKMGHFFGDPDSVRLRCRELLGRDEARAGVSLAMPTYVLATYGVVGVLGFGSRLRERTRH